MRISVSIFLGIILSVGCFAQTSGGRFVGIVTDPSGAVLKGATVTVVNERTNDQRSVVTKDNGEYVVTQLEPSEYTLRASDPGFSETEVKGISLQVGQEITRTLALPVAGTSSLVTVDGGSLASVDTSSAKIGVNVSEREVANFR